MAGKIFINYRRDDSPAYVALISQYMERAFGRRNVFIDIDIRAGQKFPEILEQRLGKCKVMVSVIGPNWLYARGYDGQPRLDNPTDWVRLEIVRALAHKIAIIPVTVGGARLPDRSELPEEMRPLLDYHAIAVTYNSIKSDMARLVNDIRSIKVPMWKAMLARYRKDEPRSLTPDESAEFFGKDKPRSLTLDELLAEPPLRDKPRLLTPDEWAELRWRALIGVVFILILIAFSGTLNRNLQDALQFTDEDFKLMHYIQCRPVTDPFEFADFGQKLRFLIYLAKNDAGKH